MPARCRDSTPSRSCWLTYADPASQTPGSSVPCRRRSRPDRTNSAIVPRCRCELERQAYLDPTRSAPVPVYRAPNVFQPRCPSSKGVKNFRAMRGCDARPPNAQHPCFLTSPTLASVLCARPGRSTSFSRTSPRSGPTGNGAVRGIRVPVRGGTDDGTASVAPARRFLPTPLVESRTSTRPFREAEAVEARLRCERTGAHVSHPARPVRTNARSAARQSVEATPTDHPPGGRARMPR